MLNETIPENWRAALGPALEMPEFVALDTWLRAEEASGKTVYPPRGERLRALRLTPLDEVKVVILGQDPYHGPGQATGLAFSVPRGVRLPPSLLNIYKELEADCGISRPEHGDLTSWARQGVLLLNTVLTVEEGLAGSHASRGWEILTEACVAAVAARSAPSVFILWGNHAREQATRITTLSAGPCLCLESAHPSPLSASRGFFGSRPFSEANRFLVENDLSSIDWRDI